MTPSINFIWISKGDLWCHQEKETDAYPSAKGEDRNVILAKTIKISSGCVMNVAYENILNMLAKGEFNLDFHFIDNRVSTAMKDKGKIGGIFHLITPGNHRANKSR